MHLGHIYGYKFKIKLKWLLQSLLIIYYVMFNKLANELI